MALMFKMSRFKRVLQYKHISKKYCDQDLLSKSNACFRLNWCRGLFSYNFYKAASSNVLKHVNQSFVSKSTTEKNGANKSGAGYLNNSVSSNYSGTYFIHTSPRRQVHPFLWAILKPVANVSTLLVGRFVRKKWKNMNDEEKTNCKKLLWKRRELLVAAVGIILLGGCINYITHLKGTPLTNRVRYVAFTKDQFNKISDFEVEKLKVAFKDKIVPSSHPGYQSIIAITQRIVEANSDLEFFRSQKWTVWVIDDMEPNAFVLSNGNIFVFTGLLKFVLTADQLAVVLGHELAHALLDHSAETVSIAQIFDLLVILTMATLWFFMPTDGIAIVTHWFYNKVIDLLLHLPYSRMLETEADEVGLQLAAKACYDIRQSSTFWELMQIHSEFTKENSAEMPHWMSTHPSNQARIENLNKLVPETLKLRKFCNCPQLKEEKTRKVVNEIREALTEWKAEQERQKLLNSAKDTIHDSHAEVSNTKIKRNDGVKDQINSKPNSKPRNDGREKG